MRKIAIAFGVLVIVLVGAVFLVPRFIDWNSYKPEIAAAVRDATGRDLEIAGDLDIKLFPGAAISASGVRLSNAEGAKAADMVKIGNVDGRIALLPLIGGTLVVERLVVTDPEVNLEVDASGRPNWVMKPAEEGAAPAPEAEREPREAGEMPIDNVRLGDVRIEGGRFTYADAVSGQDVTGTDLNVTVTMPELSEPLVAKAAVVLNNEPTNLDVSVATPQAVMSGGPAAIEAALKSKHISFQLDGNAAEGTEPGFTGALDLDIPSVGQLAAWLDRPFPKGQPDPGPLKVHAEFDANQRGATLKTAKVEGSGLTATASGAVEIAEDRLRKAVFRLDGGVLDVDRYLPGSPTPAPQSATPASPDKPSPDKEERAAATDNPLDLLSDEKFDLEPLRETALDIQVRLDGIRAVGYEVGKIDLAALMGGGRLDATIKEIQLYGGNITGQMTLDAAADVLAVDTKVDVDKVNVGDLAKAAMGGAQPPVAGVVTAGLTAKGQGTSPRTLAQGLAGGLDIDLSGASAPDSGVRISGLKAAVALPGLDKKPTVRASATYNDQPVSVDVTGDAMSKLLADDRFQLDASIASPLVTAQYSGAVLRRPTPGLDGEFRMNVDSVGKLLTWLDMPLEKGQPDPGALMVRAVMAGEAGKAVLREARIEGKAFKASATASFDATKPTPDLQATLDIQEADLNAYLPAESAQTAPPAPAPGPQPSGEPTGWSEEPIDVGFLSAATAKVEARFAKIRYRDLVIESGEAVATLADRALKALLKDVSLAEGSINATTNLAASNDGLSLDYDAKVSGVQARPLLAAFAGTDRLSGATELNVKGKANGRSQKDLVSTLNGDGNFAFTDGAIHGINLAAVLRQARTLGMDSAASEERKTDFAELSGSFVIRDGILENDDLKMLAPLVRLNGSGTVPLPARTVDYGLTATLVGSLEGQGGDTGLNGIPIPVRVTGSWDTPSFKVDWQSVFREAAKDPARLKSMSKDLQKAAEGFGIKLPTLPGGGKVPDIKGLIPGTSGTKTEPPATGTQETTPAPPDPGKTLRNLLGR